MKSGNKEKELIWVESEGRSRMSEWKVDVRV